MKIIDWFRRIRLRKRLLIPSRNPDYEDSIKQVKEKIINSMQGRASQIVAARWGIDFYWRGCEYDSDTQWEDMKNNWEAENNIEDKFGDDWKEKFNKEVNIEYQLEKMRPPQQSENE
jgi:hypothetical protein